MTPAAATAARARARASHPGLEPLWAELARRYSASDRPVASVLLRDLPEPSRAALADLLGLDRLPGSTYRVRVVDVARSLGLDGDERMRSLVEDLVGPLGNRALARAQERARRDELWTWLAAEAARLDIAEWSASVRALGVPGGDIAAHRVRLERAIDVLDRILAADSAPVVLSHLASDVLGDPHGLDLGQPVAALVVEALALRGGGARTRRAEVVRALWASAGVAADELSPSVLVLGLRSQGDDPLSGILAAMAGAGTPQVLTLGQLQRWPVRTEPGIVHVVENPSVVAFVAALGEGAATGPMVCTGGWPNVAVSTLLRQLMASGCQLRCHADFDPAGILITRHLVEHLGAEPWQMTAEAYLGAVTRAVVGFDGSVADTPWDPALADAMRSNKRIVFEEDVRQTLVARVSRGYRDRGPG